MTVPDDVVELAAETHAKAQGWPDAVSADWRERRNDAMRLALSLPEVRAALAPAPTPRVSQAEAVARKLWKATHRATSTWDTADATLQEVHLKAAQALIDDGTIPAESVPDVAEMLAAAWVSSTYRGEFVRFAREQVDAGWQFIPPQDGV